jgi:O-antigen ligase
VTSNASRARIALERLEAEDPRGHALQLLAAMAWCLLGGLGSTAESVGWGVLLAIALIRLPKSWATYRPAIRDPVWILMGVWWLWGLLSLTWAVPGTDLVEGMHPYRWLLTPLLLWPVAGRPLVLLSCLGIGVFIQTVATLLMSWGPEGLARYTEMRGLTNVGNLSWDLTVALILATAAIRFATWRELPGGLAMLAVASIAVAHAAFRFSLVTIALSVTVLLARPRTRWRSSGRWMLIAAMISVGVVLFVREDTAAVERTRQELTLLRSMSWGEAVIRAGSSRGGGIVAAVEFIGQRPWFGGGRASYPVLLEAWTSRRAAESPDDAPLYENIATITNPHNIYLLSWVEGGVVSVLLVTGGLWTLAVRLWRRSAREPIMATALAVYGAVLVGSFISIVEFRTPGGLIALCMAISRHPCSLPRDEIDDA